MGKFEYSPLEQQVQGWQPGWFKDAVLNTLWDRWYPPSAPIMDRNQDRARVTKTKPYQWAKEVADVRIKVEPPSTGVWLNAMYGMPLQRVALNAPMVEWIEWDTIAKGSPSNPAVRKVNVPLPVDNAWWPEEGPQIGGGSDKHVMLYRPETQEAWELLGATPGLRMCLKMAYWQKDTIRRDDIPVCAGGKRMTSFMRQVGDKGCVVPLVCSNYIGGDGSMAPNSGWPTCGARYALSTDAYKRLKETHKNDPEALALTEDAYTHGFFVYDRSRQLSPTFGVGYYAGKQWGNLPQTLQKMNIYMKDLMLVEATT